MPEVSGVTLLEVHVLQHSCILQDSALAINGFPFYVEGYIYSLEGLLPAG